MRFIIVPLCVFLFSNLNSQNIRIFGFVKDAITKENLIYSTCYDSINKKGAVSNALGQFLISHPKNKKAKLIISHLGYKNTEIELTTKSDTTINVFLSPLIVKIDEVGISAHTSLEKDNVLGKISVSKELINSVPSFIGVSDLMKSISFLPGISSGREGYSNIFIRGGDRGQNLVLIDGIKLYNTNHVGGFISTINSDILKQIDVYKGGFPARYGGRCSGIIDMYSKDGNKEKIKGKFGVGILSSYAMLEGPIGNKLTYYIAGRSSYFNLLTSDYKYTVYDLNSKITYTFNQNHKISLSNFKSKDKQSYKEDGVESNIPTVIKNSMTIVNDGLSLLYRGKMSKQLYNETQLTYSKYYNKTTDYLEEYYNGIKIKNETYISSHIADYTIKSRFDYYLNNNITFRWGSEISRYLFTPGFGVYKYSNANAESEEQYSQGFEDNQKATECNVFIENELSITQRLKMNAGMRGVGYYCNKKAYYGMEPRISLTWLHTNKLSFKSNFMMINQFNHVLINNEEGIEREVWFAASDEIPPQESKQVSVGVFYNDKIKKQDLSFEMFYKKMSNLQEYKAPSYETFAGANISDLLLSGGQGVAKGIELYYKKESEKLYFNLNYTLSWSKRKFDGINQGKWFPFVFDRRHDIALVSRLKLKKRRTLAAMFVFQSGAKITMPNGYSKDDNISYNYFIFDNINNASLPTYHRLDLSYKTKKISKRGNIKSWTFNIFNVYARQNAVYITYDSNNGKVYKKSLFTITPSITYSYEF